MAVRVYVNNQVKEVKKMFVDVSVNISRGFDSSKTMKGNIGMDVI